LPETQCTSFLPLLGEQRSDQQSAKYKKYVNAQKTTASVFEKIPMLKKDDENRQSSNSIQNRTVSQLKGVSRYLSSHRVQGLKLLFSYAFVFGTTSQCD